MAANERESTRNTPPGEPALPSDAELKLLRELWRFGEQTVAELHTRVAGEWQVGYTTVLKLLQRMYDKRLVERRVDGRAHVYRPAVREERTERRLVQDFLARAFGGSVERLIQRALPAEKPDPEELAEIRRMLDRLEG